MPGVPDRLALDSLMVRVTYAAVLTDHCASPYRNPGHGDQMYTSGQDHAIPKCDNGRGLSLKMLIGIQQRV